MYTINHLLFIIDLLLDPFLQLIEFFKGTFNLTLSKVLLGELFVNQEGFVVGDPLVSQFIRVLEVWIIQHLFDCGSLASLLRKALCH